jgi:hypothetical protein
VRDVRPGIPHPFVRSSCWFTGSGAQLTNPGEAIDRPHTSVTGARNSPPPAGTTAPASARLRPKLSQLSTPPAGQSRGNVRRGFGYRRFANPGDGRVWARPLTVSQKARALGPDLHPALVYNRADAAAPIGRLVPAGHAAHRHGCTRNGSAAGTFTPRQAGVLTVATAEVPGAGFWEGTAAHPSGGPRSPRCSASRASSAPSSPGSPSTDWCPTRGR